MREANETLEQRVAATHRRMEQALVAEQRAACASLVNQSRTASLRCRHTTLPEPLNAAPAVHVGVMAPAARRGERTPGRTHRHRHSRPPKSARRLARSVAPRSRQAPRRDETEFALGDVVDTLQQQSKPRRGADLLRLRRHARLGAQRSAGTAPHPAELRQRVALHGAVAAFMAQVRRAGANLRVEVWDEAVPASRKTSSRTCSTNSGAVTHVSPWAKRPGLWSAICERMARLIDASIIARSVTRRGGSQLRSRAPTYPEPAARTQTEATKPLCSPAAHAPASTTNRPSSMHVGFADALGVSQISPVRSTKLFWRCADAVPTRCWSTVTFEGRA